METSILKIPAHNAQVGGTKMMQLLQQTESHSEETVLKWAQKNVMTGTPVMVMAEMETDQALRLVGFVLTELQLPKMYELSVQLDTTKIVQ